MSSFTAPLAIEPAGTLWRTTRGFAYAVGREGSPLLIEVPAGTLTDLGTVPWPVAWLAKPSDPAMAAAYVLHDALITTHDLSRFMADCIFYEALLVLGVRRWKALAMFCGVRLYALTFARA